MRKRLSTLESRWAFLVVVLSFLGTTFASESHWLAVPHRLCEVHGTIEHGLPTEILRPTCPTPEGPIVRESERAHDECALGPFARTEGVLLARAAERGPLLVEVSARAFVPAVPELAVPLFLLAPSRSPPA